MKKKSEPWEGDHGFTGMALLAWKRQRQAQLDLIEHDAWRTSTDAKERGWYVLLKVARNACVCPRTYGPGGTPEGERLVSEFAGWPAKPDLSWANLSGADLSGADLSGAYLYGAYLYGADLSRAYLSGADLSRAYLSGAYLYGADLSRADLSGADLSRAYLSGADLSGADLSRAYLSGADLGAWERGPDGFARRKASPKEGSG